MSQRLKRWESPRREGRNSKGKGGSARHRQVKKQQQMLRSRLKDNSKPNDSSGKRPQILFPLFLLDHQGFCRSCHNAQETQRSSQKESTNNVSWSS